MSAYVALYEQCLVRISIFIRPFLYQQRIRLYFDMFSNKNVTVNACESASLIVEALSESVCESDSW